MNARISPATLANPYPGRSTSRRPGCNSKKLSNRVAPGLLLVLASPLRWVTALMALDLPALERPATATSTPVSGGNCPSLFALVRNRTSG